MRKNVQMYYKITSIKLLFKTPLDFIESSSDDMGKSSDEKFSDNDDLPPENLSPIERVENLYQFDCSNKRR
jgi:hypothetical protein